MAISVGSVEVDVVPNATGVRQRLQNQLVPAANSVGDEVGRVMGRYISAAIAASVQDGLTRGGRQAQAPATRQGSATGSTFARAFKTRLEAALANLPEIHLNANSSDAEREIANIRAQMTALKDVRIGIDISSADATAIIDRLQERLTRLSASDADVAIRVDAGAASAQLAAFQAEVNRLDGQTAHVDVDADSATSSLGGLTTAAIAFGPAILPVLPVVAAGLGAIAAAGVAAAAGIGSIALVAVPAFKQIGNVLQLQKAAQTAATTATAAGGQASSQAASRSLQLASAQQAVATAERTGARQISQAQQQVTQARQNAAQAAAQASLSSQQAARQVEEAERSLSDAQKAATQAQLDLTAARKQAAQELEDLNNQLVDSQLSQRDAALQVTEAQQNLNATLADPKATALQRAQAQLAYDEAVQHLKEQTTSTKRLKTETAAANKAGVAGSKTVKTAQDQLAAAQQAVADKTTALKDAQAAQARTATQNAQQIADAQQKIADAQANVAVVQQQAADQAASAQRSLQQAQLSTAGGADTAATAQAKYRAELAKLTPAARGTLVSYVKLRDAFGGWSRALQPAVMPIFTRALDGIRRALPKVTPFVLTAADAIGKLQDKASKGFKNPWWATLRKDLQGSVEPALIGFGVAFGNIFVGMAGIVDAFLPHMGSISDTVQRITGKFAGWGKGLKGSPEFERFLSYSADKAPLIGDTLGKIAGAFIDIGVALSPVSGPLLQVIGGLAQGVGWLAKNVPGLVVGLYGLYVATKLWAAWQLILNGALVAFEFIASFGPWGWIVLGIAAVVLAVLYAWKHFTWFRDGVKAVWSAIATATSWLWEHALKPFFHAVADIATWLWKNVLAPVFAAIGLVIVTWWTHVVKPQFNAVKNGIKLMADVFTWLYEKIIKPVWKNAIGPLIATVWQNQIKPTFAALRSAVSHIADAFKDAKVAIGKQWAGIKAATKGPINFVIGTIWNNGVVPIWKKIDKWVPGLPTLGKLPLLAQGGTLPVQPGIFNRPTAIVGEGRSQFPEYVIPTDPRYRSRAVALHAQAGTQLLAGGGIIGDVLGGIKNVGGAIGSAFSSATKFLTNPGAALDGLFGKLLKPLDAVKDSGWGKLAASLPKAIFKGLKGLVTGAGAASGLGGDLGAHGASASQAQQLARLLLSHYGWSQAQMPPLIKLWNGESGWRWNALNASSGAYGIPQSLPASKMASAGSDWRTNAGTQIKWGLTYIHGRYGSPANAWSTWQSRSPHWYDQGGMLQPGMNLAFNGTGRPEPVLTPAQWNAIEGSTARGSDGPPQPVIVELHPKAGALGDFIDVRILDSQQQLVQVLNAG